MTWLDGVTLETVIVHTRDGPSLKGVRSAVYDDALVLRDVLALHENDAPAQLAGVVVVPRDQVMFMQLLQAG